MSVEATHGEFPVAGKLVAAPTLVVDCRERTPLPFSRLKTQTGTLYSGDYSVLGAEESFSVERKSIPDLVACCTAERDRFERELLRLRGYRFKRLLIVGSESDILEGNFRSLASPKAILASLHCFEIRYDLPVVFCDTPALAGRRIENWALWFARELHNSVGGLLKGSQIENARLRTERLKDQSDGKTINRDMRAT
jgi:ERCC4-type nuclease